MKRRWITVMAYITLMLSLIAHSGDPHDEKESETIIYPCQITYSSGTTDSFLQIRSMSESTISSGIKTVVMK